MSEKITSVGSSIEKSWDRATHINKGSDSEVRKFEGKVIKRYPSIDKDQLKLYRDTTSKVAKILDGREVETPIGSLTLKVNPIEEVVESTKDFTMYSVSPFVEGENMNKYIFEKEGRGALNELESLLTEISTEVMRETRILGISIIPWNTVGVNLSKKKNRQLVITDLSGSVLKIGKFLE